MPTDRNLTRRSVLAGVASTAGLAASGRTVTGSSPIDGRFIVDTRSTTGTAWASGVTVVRELPLFDLAIVEGVQESLSGVRAMQDFEVQTSPPKRPTLETEETIDTEDIEREFTAGGIGNPSSHQWDKEAQSIPSVHEEGITGDGATISVIDDGISATHPDVSPNLDLSRSTTVAGPSEDGRPANTEQNHGTEVASVAAGTGELYVLGVAPEATLISQNVFGATDGAAFSDILTGLSNSIDEGADVANVSLGTPLPFPSPTVDLDLLIETYERVAETAQANDMFIASSAGNESVNLDTAEGTSIPTQVPGFFSVSATGPLGFVPEENAFSFPLFGISLDSNPNQVNGELDAETHLPATYTTFGAENLDVSAPGGNLLNADAGTGAFNDAIQVASQDGILGLRFTLIIGTSFSAPQVAGQAALIYAENQEVASQQVRQHIRNTANQVRVDYEISSTDTYFGEDGELPDDYQSEVYRGAGHVDIERSALKDVPFAGGLTIGSGAEAREVFPADPDDDGLYEDVNGDGEVNMEDAEALYNLALQAFPPADANDAFDFNGDGQFDMRDVQAFIRQL